MRPAGRAARGAAMARKRVREEMRFMVTGCFNKTRIEF